MQTISDYMGERHRECDELFALAEEAVGNDDWDAAAKKFAAFHHGMEQHFIQEEATLFPAFEQATGMTMGPTYVMKNEHQNMREVFDEMKQAVEAKDADRYLGLSETVLVLMQQHNLKEDQVLYPMMDQSLADSAGQLIAQLELGREPKAGACQCAGR
jgi:iron-sulfur cluster repair protein YtfE (RIC family)